MEVMWLGIAGGAFIGIPMLAVAVGMYLEKLGDAALIRAQAERDKP